MPRMYSKPAPSGAGQSVFIATPTYGDLGAGYTFSLFYTGQALDKAGIRSELAIYSGDCHVDDARNRLVRDFLESECTDLLFIDADLRWQPESVVSIVKRPEDIVAGTYPLKQEEEKYPVMLNGHRKDDLLEANAVPTGFLRIKRHVLQKLYDESVKFKPKSDNRSDLGVIFERTVHDGMRWGGDYTFCLKARKYYKIYLDPKLYFDHSGEHIYGGRFSSFLMKEQGITLPGLIDVQKGTDGEEVYTELFNEWGNQWSASPALLCALASIARGLVGDILEAGAGLSSLVMAAANPSINVISLESDPEWVKKILGLAEEHNLTNLTVVQAPLVNGWYDFEPKEDYALVVCDGPCRQDSDRSKVLDYVGNAMFIMDDADDPQQLEQAQEYATRHGRTTHILGKQRPFLIMRGLHGIQASAV